MIIAIASGKGGTGKTTFAVNLAHTLAYWKKKVRLLDCDVEEPNDHLFVNPDFSEEQEVKVKRPVWDKEKCIACGKCAELCNYNAIALVKENVLVFSELCHSCGVCSFVCPQGALTEEDDVIGKVQVAPEDKPFFFAHGLLNIGEALAPKVVSAVKKHIDPGTINIIDASPGTSCSVVQAVDGADVVVLVTEPTPFGLNDLKLAVGLSLKMRIPTGILINRSDGSDSIIEEYAESVGVPIIGRILFKREYAEEYSAGKILVHCHKDLEYELLSIYDDICALRSSFVPAVPDEEIFVESKENVAVFEEGSATGYKEITVISGKGGTGKTTVLGAFAMLAKNKVLADNDVDAADLHLLLEPTVLGVHDFVGGQKASIDPEKCVACGKCAEVCRYHAIGFDGPENGAVQKTYKIDNIACEGCGFCKIVCPADAITLGDNISGSWFMSQTGSDPMVHARLGIAEENSGRLVTQVRSKAQEIAEDLKRDLILADGPPGTGCPVIASISGSDLVIIVTEPTVSGVHDMERVFKLTEHFDVPSLVIINKADLNLDQASRIEEIAHLHNSKVIARIPFDRTVHDALMVGKTVIEYDKTPAREAICAAWIVVEDELKAQGQLK